MENIRIGDVIIVKTISEIRIIVTHLEKDNFQGVYFSNVSQEFKYTPMLPITIAEKIKEQVSREPIIATSLLGQLKIEGAFDLRNSLDMVFINMKVFAPMDMTLILIVLVVLVASRPNVNTFNNCNNIHLGR